MAIIQSTIKIYSDPTLQTLVGTFTDTGTQFEETITGLAPGTRYYATVQSEDSLGQWSTESAPYAFTTVPNVVLSGYVNYDSSGFVRQMTNTTTDVTVQTNGICWDDNNLFTNPHYVNGTMVSGLNEHTTYYYKPFVIDEFNRRWVNDSDVDSVTTLYNVPAVNWYTIYGADSTTFSAVIDINSTDTLTSVIAEVTLNGITTGYNLTASTGQQFILIDNLTPNSNYSIVIKATNSAGTGTSTTEYFTTEPAVSGMVVSLLHPIVDNSNNEVNVTSIATYNSGEITLIDHSVELYTNDQHSGAAAFSDTGNTDTMVSTFSSCDPDTTYWIFGKVTYTVGSDPTILTAWSNAEQIQTYTLMQFGAITVTTNSMSVPFTVQGTALQVSVEYSIDGISWTSIPVTDPTGETLVVSGLTSNTTYYLRGTCESTAGWQNYITDTFQTYAGSVHITSISNITGETATINIQII